MEHAADLDREAAFPAADVAALAATGLLTAPVPRAAGGLGLGSEALGSPTLLAVLRLLGSGNLSLGRLYEGHVNAWRLIATYASSPSSAPGRKPRARATCSPSGTASASTACG